MAALLALVFLGLSGCAGFGSPTIYMVVIGKSTQGSYWEAVQEGLKLQAEKENIQYKYVAPGSPDDVDAQMQLLSEAIDGKPSVIAIAPIMPTAPVELINKAKDLGIPVVAFESPVEAVLPAVTVGTNNHSAGVEAARHMCSLISEGSSVATVSDALGRQFEIDRYLGIKDGLSSECQFEVKLLDPITLDADPQAGITAFNDALKDENLDGVFFTTQNAATAILEQYEPGEDHPVLIGFDAGDAQVTAIRSGLMAGAIAQNPTGMGSSVVSSAARLAQGSALPSLVDTGFFWYDKATIDKPNIKPAINA